MAKLQMRSRDQVLTHKAHLLKIAVQHGVRALWLFGSAARGEESAKSDLDFLVELEKGRSLVDLVAMKRDLETLFGMRVDVFMRRTLKPHILVAAEPDLVPILPPGKGVSTASRSRKK